jgi:putative heme-binding domain-containing protein
LFFIFYFPMRFPVPVRVALFLLTFSCHAAGSAAEPTTPFELKTGDRVVFLGDTLMEREQAQGWLELMLTTRFPERDVTFRNLGWSADTPSGDSRLGLSLLQAGHEPAGEGWAQLVKQIEEAKPTVVFVGYGMANSFDGTPGLEKFETSYDRLLDTLEKSSPGVRLVLLSPLPHETLGPPWPATESHNAELAAYARVISKAAVAHHARYISLFDLLRARAHVPAQLTVNGIHASSAGYRVIAETIEDQLFGPASPGAWRTSAQADGLRQTIQRKNEWFFYRSRPANMAYIFGFRKREQGRNATEVLKFDTFVATAEKQIAQLRALKGGPSSSELYPTVRTSPASVPLPHPDFTVADGFTVSLWAENPLLDKPVQMNFDAKGRLWVASSEVYPQIEPRQAPSDKIIVLEDTTGSGKADKATVFASGLLIPTGLEVGDGGVYVAQSTELLHFRDTDGDGRADERRTVLSGFGTEDTHHNLHTLHWGPDGRLYMNQSVYTRTNTETPHGVVRLKAGGVFRFDPRDETLQVIYRGWVNAWGHQFDDYGQSFVTDGAGNRGISWALPGATYQTLAPARRELQSISPGNYPKFCSLEIVRSDAFPADWQGDLITCDFRAHRVVRFKVADQGAGYVTSEQPDLLRTTADSFRPIDVRIGPDGALYVADWSNPIIQHGEVDFRDPRRDKSHGRIWRIAAKNHPPRRALDLTTLANPALLDRLLSPNGYEQEQARRVLIERGAVAVLPDLQAWSNGLAPSNELGRLRALWMYRALNHDEPALTEALLHGRDARIRAAAIRSLPATGRLEELARLATDENPRVRAEAVRALATRNSAQAAEAAFGVLSRPMDPFLDYALWLTINDLATPWLAAVKSGAWPAQGHEAELEFGLKAVEPELAGDVLGGLLSRGALPLDGRGPWIELIGAAGRAGELRALFDRILSNQLDEAGQVRALRALGEAARLRNVRPSGEHERLAGVIDRPQEAVRIAAMTLASHWKLSAVMPRIIQVAGDRARSAAERDAAFDTLRSIANQEAAGALKSLAARGASDEIRREAILTLASIDPAVALPDVIRLLESTSNEVEALALWRRLLKTQGLSGRLATALPKAKIPPATARAGLRIAREGTQHEALVTVLLDKAGLALSTAPLSSDQLKALAAEAVEKGNPARGELIYRRSDVTCTVCHSIGGAGGKLGPDLTSIGASAPVDYLVESLVSPNAKIKEGYHSVLITTRDGRELNGMITSETSAEVTLRDSGNALTSIPTQSIVNRKNVGSLMPSGLIDRLLPEERLDLVKFLSQLGKPGHYDASMGGVARVWKIYEINSRNEHLGAHRVTQGDFSLPSWATILSLVDGSLPDAAITEADPDRGSVRGLYVATQFTATQEAAVDFALSGEAIHGWLNGKPLTIGQHFQLTPVKGNNTLVLQLPQDRPATSLKLTAQGVTFVLE